jgi:phospholipid/cholesterol/gamma-HCH transport system permease protein
VTARNFLTGRLHGDGLALAAAGAWTAEHAHTLEQLIDAATRRAQVRHVAIDMARVERIDSYGAWLLERALRIWSERGCDTHVTGLSADYRGLFEKVHAGTHALTPEPHRSHSLVATLESVGRTMALVWDDVLLLFQMAGSLVMAFARVIGRPATFRFTPTVHHLERVAWNAVPIILLITLLIGAILAQQGIFHFRQFGADIYVVDMIGVLVLREVGVLIVCIMVAGRSGSAYTAELGSMKMREEIDALRIMGFDPVEVLILPRIVALMIAVPVLTFLGAMAALYGGGLVAWLYGGIDPDIFIARLHDSISVKSFAVGMVKAPFMALVIGLVACMEGLKVEGSAESLGAKTTDSVVKSIFIVIVLDGAFAIFFASIGI